MFFVVGSEGMIREILFFVLLSPGLLVTIPPGEKGWFLSKETSVLAVFLHAAFFALALYITGWKSEGFQEESGSEPGSVAGNYSNDIASRQSARIINNV